MSVASRLYWWGLDYVYASWQQARSLFRRRCPETFMDGDAALPAIVLLPGVYETWSFLEPVALRLNARGHRVFAVPELGVNRMPIPRSAQVVQLALQRLAVEHDVAEVILLAHSKGGLIGKQLMLADQVGVTIAGMVAIATPFSGSSYARFLPSRTLRDFSPDDAVLVELSGRRRVNEQIVSIYSSFDPHIPGKSALEGARNVELPIAGHFLLLGNPLLGDAVEQAVAGIPAR